MSIQRQMEALGLQIMESKLREQLHMEEKAKQEAAKATSEAEQAARLSVLTEKHASKLEADMKLPKMPGGIS